MPYKKRNKIFKDKYFKLNNHKVSKTITSHMKFDCNMYIHPTQARGLTPREAARIQSFPDNYFFEGTKSQCYSQIGNAVPPLLSKYICMALEKIND
jgi:DNA (cytosine-5)-methyltransferase 1